MTLSNVPAGAKKGFSPCFGNLSLIGAGSQGLGMCDPDYATEINANEQRQAGEGNTTMNIWRICDSIS